MFGNKLINTNAGGGCTDTVDLYNPFPDGGGVALYQLNGNATDVSGNYDGTATNVTYGAGEFGQAGVFNGSSSYISVPNSAGNNLTTISASCWFKKNAQGGTSVLMNNGGADGSAQQGWYLAILSSGFIVFSSSGSGDSSAPVSGTVNYADNIWHNVVLTYTAVGVGTSIYNVYVDGNTTPIISGTNGRFTGTATQPLVIGRFARVAIEYFNGSIDQVRIFSRALRPYEVEALYTEEYCTPTIVPSEHFNTVTYTGNGSANHSITGVGFAPDFTWIKNRDTTTFNALVNSVVGENYIQYSNSTSAGETNANIVTSLDSDGFTVGIETTSNGSGQDLVSWNFKAGGAAVTANSIEATNATRSANPAAGFSVIKFTASTSTASPPPMNYIEHGLDSTPKMVIYKTTNSASAWRVMHVDNGQKWIDLNLTAAAVGPFTYTIWDNTPTSIGARSNYAIGRSEPYIAYCFAEVEGFSNFGSYVGNGSTSGPTVITGFEPAFVMIKWASGSPGNWQMMDNKRGADIQLYANLSNGEGPIYDGVDFLSNGFQLKTDYVEFNGSGQSYIYMAFAADPTTIEPSLEDSFNTVTYTGNGTARSITGVGFQPDLVWAKARTFTYYHVLSDTVRGVNKQLYSNSTEAEQADAGYFSEFNTDGFDLGVAAGLNNSGTNYVAWCWKGAELPAINSNGSIKSVVSANPAAGFSIVSYKGNSVSGATVGHGLNDAPKIVIYKRRDSGANWIIKSSLLGVDNYLLFTTGQTEADSGVFWNSTLPTSSVFTLGNSASVNVGTYIAYCFAEVAGFSKFGSYTGNGLTGASGPSITTGFEPAFLLIKGATNTGAWFIMDNKRSPTNPRQLLLQPASNAAEENVGNAIDFNSDGFQILDTNDSRNGNGQTYIYMAFANQF